MSRMGVVDWAVVAFLVAILALVALVISSDRADGEFDPEAWALGVLNARCDTLEMAYWVHEARLDRLEAALAERP